MLGVPRHLPACPRRIPSMRQGGVRASVERHPGGDSYGTADVATFRGMPSEHRSSSYKPHTTKGQSHDAERMQRGNRSLVIVGAGLAGGNAAVTLREEGWRGRILLLGAEPGIPFGRPPLSKTYLRGEEDLSAWYVRPTNWYGDHDARVAQWAHGASGGHRPQATAARLPASHGSTISSWNSARVGEIGAPSCPWSDSTRHLPTAHGRGVQRDPPGGPARRACGSHRHGIHRRRGRRLFSARWALRSPRSYPAQPRWAPSSATRSQPAGRRSTASTESAS